jgi:hypothetical protein
MSIVEQAVRARPFEALALRREVAALGLSTPAESTRFVRATRRRR